MRKLAAAVEYIAKDSLVHQMNTLTKLVWALLVMTGGLLFSDYRYLVTLFGSVLLVAVVARVLKDLLPVIAGLSVFALILMLLQMLLFNEGEKIFFLIPVINVLPVTDQGLFSGLAMSFRMLTLVFSFLVVMTTTQTRDIILTLVEKIKVPYDYAFMFMTALRFVPTFMGEVKKITEAQQARGFALEGWNPIKKIKAYAPVAVPLVLISLNKAENLAMAMETRGYGSGPRTYLREPKMHMLDYVLMVVMVLLFVAMAAARMSGHGTM